MIVEDHAPSLTLSMLGPSALSWCSAACLMVQNRNSMPSCLRRVFVPEPYMHSDTVWTLAGKVLAAAMLRTNNDISRQRTAGPSDVWGQKAKRCFGR